MTEFYFDTETTDLDPTFGKVITIQWRQINNGQPVGNLRVVKEWEVGEEELIRTAMEIGVFDTTATMWDFVPVGNNLRFDYTFLYHRAKQYGLLDNAILEYLFRGKPMIDIRSILVIMNDYQFSGSGLHHFTKKMRGDRIPTWYEREEYGKILDYIELECKEFIRFLRNVAIPLKVLGHRFKGLHDDGTHAIRSP